MEQRSHDPQPIGYSSLATGVTELEIRFAKAPMENMVIYVWTEFDFNWELSPKNGGIIIDPATSRKRKKGGDQ